MSTGQATRGARRSALPTRPTVNPEKQMNESSEFLTHFEYSPPISDARANFMSACADKRVVMGTARVTRRYLASLAERQDFNSERLATSASTSAVTSASL